MCAERDVGERKNSSANVDRCAWEGRLRGGAKRVNLCYSGSSKSELCYRDIALVTEYGNNLVIIAHQKIFR